jgi:hypothetical protein
MTRGPGSGGIASRMRGFPAPCPRVGERESTLPAPFLGGGGGGRGRLRGRGARPAAAGGGGGDAAERAAGRPVAAAGAAEVARLPHVVVVEVAELGLPAPTSRARQRLARARGRRGRRSQRRRERSRRRSHRVLRRRRSALLRSALVGGVWRLDDLAEELESSCVGVHGPRFHFA